MQAPPMQRAARMLELQDEEVQDVIAALNFLKAQPFVDTARLAISGCSYGGIQTLLAGEHDLGVKALIPFAPGTQSWAGSSDVASRLIRAVDRDKAPVFLLQAQNDYNLGPSQVLGKEAGKKHLDLRTKIYPPFGRTTQDGHWGFCSTATDVWGADVLAFLDAHLQAK